MDNMSGQQSKRTRKGVRKVRMPIKVLYKLESNPEATMVAQIEQRIPVDVLPIRKKLQTKEGTVNSMPLFARISLKACIQSICMASPELLANSTKDYVLYAVDPVEAYRASLRQVQSTSSHSSSSQEASPSHRKSRSSAAFMVGKGYLSHALSQEGSGVSTVHGRVRGEFDDEDDEEEELAEDDEDDEEFWDSRILEVFLELKESNSAENASTMDFLAGERALSSRQDSGISGNPTNHQKRENSLGPIPLKEISGINSNVDQSRPSNSGGLPSKSGSQKQLLHLLQALQAHAQQDSKSLHRARSSFETSDAPNTSFRMVSSPIGKSESKRNRARFSSPSKSSSTSSSMHPNGAQSSPVKATTKSLASSSKLKSNLLKTKKKASSSLNNDAQSPILGGVTPGYEADYLSGPSPSYGDNNVGDSSKSANAKTLVKRNVCSASNDEQCYNCGIRGEVYWRYLELKDDSEAKFYDSSICFFNGRKSFRSCNACGIYFLRYKGVSRPEFVWREHEAKRLEKLKRELSQSNSSTGSEDDEENNAKRKANEKAKRKGSKFSRTLSEACAIDAKRLANGSKTSKEEEDSTRISKGKRKAKEEIKEEKSEGSSEERKKKKRKEVSIVEEEEKEEMRKIPTAQDRKFVEDFEKARLRDLVMDQDGNWRSKRSILENPTNRRVGRPPGRKTGAGLGRQRNQKAALKAAAAAAAELRQNPKDDSTDQSNETDDTPMDNGKEAIDLVGNQAVADALQAILSSSSPIRPASLNHGSNMTQLPHSSFAVPFAPNHSMMQHHNMPHSTPGHSYHHQNKTPLSVSRARYGAPAHLMMSSPATAFQTVMDEADTDWKALFGLNGDGISNVARRSPRKKPAGVYGDVNPYASNKFMEPDSNPNNTINAEMLMQMTSSSPLTRNRVKSGQFEWAFSSSDDITGQKKKKVSSALTSPTSPSPTRTRTNLMSDRKKMNPSQIMLEAGPISNSRTTNRIVKQSNKNKQRELDSLDDGPFVGLSAIDVQSGLDDDEDRLEEDDGPGSPTLGRSRRLDEKKRNADNKTDVFSNESIDLVPSGDWQRNASMRDLFPTPSPSKGWDATANGSPSQAIWNSPSSWALRMPTPSPVKALNNESAKNDQIVSSKNTPVIGITSLPEVKTDTTEKKDLKNEPYQKQESASLAPPVQQRRKPLPATVEDASPSEASNPSPNEDDEDEEEDEGDLDGNGEMVIDMTDGENLSALMEMFEDPYGLLAAAGINFTGSNATGNQNTSLDNNEITTNQSNEKEVNNNNLAQIELFKKFDFGKELGFFNQAGANGIAANAGPSAAIGNTSSSNVKPNAMATMISPSKIKINKSLLKNSPRKKIEENKQVISGVSDSIQVQPTTNTEVNFGDWIWSDVQGTPTKQVAK